MEKEKNVYFILCVIFPIVLLSTYNLSHTFAKISLTWVRSYHSY